MSIEEKKQSLSRGESVKPEKAPPPPKVEKPDTSIFRGKPNLSMNEATWKLKQASPYIPNTGGAMYSREEREAIAKDVQKYGGGYLETRNIPRIFKALEKERVSARTGAEKLRIERKMNYLKRELLGK